MRAAVLITAILAMLSPALAAGDFPLASCKGWSGTITEREGIDSNRASMAGIVTKADFHEYCERDPGGETTAYGGSLTTAQCVKKHMAESGKTKLSATANCSSGVLTFKASGQKAERVKFPLASEADTSCASGMPPLIEQFKALCPAAAAKWGIE